MDFERDSRRSREPNLTPLVDIVLLLVIFFMLSTSFVVSESMELSLPSGAATPSNLPDILRIRVTPTGEVVVNDDTMDRTRLNQLLVTQLAAKPETKIAIFTTPGVSVQQLVSILDEVYLTGGTNVQVDKIEYAR